MLGGATTPCAHARGQASRAVLGFSSADPRRGRVLFTDARANPVLAARRAATQDLLLPAGGRRRRRDCTPDVRPVAATVGAAMYTGAMAELAQQWLAGRPRRPTSTPSSTDTPWRSVAVAPAQPASAKFSVSASTIGRHTGAGRSWPMPSTTTNRAPWIARARLRPLRIAPSDRRAVDDDRRRADAAGVAQQAAGAEDGVELAQHALRVVAAGASGSRRGGAAASSVGRKLGPLMIAMLRTSTASLVLPRRVLRGRVERQLDHPPPRQRRQRLVRTGHDQRQRRDPVGMAARQHLRDHAAHRRADDVRALDAEVVEQALHVVGHVDERVGHRAACGPSRGAHPRVYRAVGPLTVHLGRQPDVAVVEADDPIARARPAARRTRPATSAAARRRP